VKIQNWDTKLAQDEDRVLYDYQLWRSARSITDLGAYRDASANLVGADGVAQPAVAAEITASAFRIAPERPLLGRVLDASDERAGAAPVVLLGHEVWTRRFGADPQILGRSVQARERLRDGRRRDAGRVRVPRRARAVAAAAHRRRRRGAAARRPDHRSSAASRAA
jgi:hypothetical protein